MQRRFISFALATALVTFSAHDAAARTHIFKVATLAPEGSTWWKVMKLADKRLRELSHNTIRMRLYPGGVAGDEPDFVRKMQVGLLQGAAITSIGLSQIQPALMVLQAPGLFRNWDELDAVRKKMSDRLKKLLADKGFEVLMWGDAGFNRPFADIPLRMPTDFQKTKPWCWTQDGVTKAFLTSVGATPVLLGVPDVLPGLQTGLINSVTTAPLVMVSLQWMSRVKYMLDIPYSVTIGAVVVTKRSIDALSDSERAIVAQVSAEIAPKLAAAVRADNKSAIDAIRKAGVDVIEPTAQQKAAWEAAEKRGADAAAGKVYPAELLKEVRQAVAAYRAQGGK